ncbi:MAG: AIR synthase family protein [candidate division WOR-3 bacterium]|nr:MAG: AIR synthase family protein [candidate division WOR-3 bacterium]
MIKLPEIGKISAEVFKQLIFPHLGAHRSEILVGPQHGVDVGIVQIANKAVAMTSDPVFIVPEYGFERAAWFAIHILASDIVTSGLPPTYLAIDLNLPLSMTEEELTIVWRTIDTECKKMGMAIVTGHTARYDNCQYPMVGGATVIAVGNTDDYVSPKFISVGDKIVITKGPAIEASGIFATMFPKYLARHCGEEFSRQAQSLFYQMSVVHDALTAVKIGVRDQGVSSMHDATECGIWGGLHELAEAASVGMSVVQDSIMMDPYVEKICDLFKIDPYKSISEGTLIITCRPHKAEYLVRYLHENGINASIVGEITERKYGLKIIECGKERKLIHPEVDPFWKAFYNTLREIKKFEE